MIKYKDQCCSEISREDEACLSKEITTTDIFFRRLDYLVGTADGLKDITAQKLQYFISVTPQQEKQKMSLIGNSSFFNEASTRINNIESTLNDIRLIIESLDV